MSIMNRSMFRAYDIRGVADRDLTVENIFLIGQGLGTLVLNAGGTQMCVARDGRLSGLHLSQALIQGILASGCDVIDLGLVPTPVLYFATNILDQHSGVMLTGSHNPPDYNGLKIVLQGKMLAEGAMSEFYDRIKAKDFLKGEGEYFSLDMSDRYISYIKKNISIKRRLKIVVDAGSGATGEIAPRLFSALGCDVIPLYCDIDGRFPFHHADPSEPHNLEDLIRQVKLTHADLGLAFDGDGDRLGVVTPKGQIIWPDRLLMLFSRSILKKLPKQKIIFDVKCSLHLEKVIQEHGGEPIMWKTGHSLIKSKLAETKAALAGEMSGHFFFNDRWFGFDDALYSGARLLEILSSENKNIDTIFETIPNSVNTPEIKIAIPDEEKFEFMQQLKEKIQFTESYDLILVDGLRVNFKKGWGLIRPSNTSPCLVLRFEADDFEFLKQMQEWFKTWLLSVNSNLAIPF